MINYYNADPPFKFSTKSIVNTKRLKTSLGILQEKCFNVTRHLFYSVGTSQGVCLSVFATSFIRNQFYTLNAFIVPIQALYLLVLSTTNYGNPSVECFGVSVSFLDDLSHQRLLISYQLHLP